MDIGTGLALFGSAKIVGKILGPTAEYIGEGIKSWTEKRINNVKNIFAIAQKKLGSKIEEDGTVPPKVLKGILDEGSFCDDHISAEYFGGVLASSRSGVSRDDRGAVLISLLSRLSTYQIRTHYIFYHFIKKTFDGTNIDPNTSEGRDKLELFIPQNIYETAMEFEQEENINVLSSHIIFGLQKESLIGDIFGYGPKEHIKKWFKNAPTKGIIFQPSVLGIELFLWAYGKPHLFGRDYLKPCNEFEIDSKINLLDGALKTHP